MHEPFEFHIGNEPVYLRDLPYRKFAGEHDPRRALFLPEFHGVFIRRIRLRGDMQRKIRGDLFRKIDDAGIAYDRAVRADRRERLKIVPKQSEIGVTRVDIRRHVHFLAERVRLLDGGR